jgi:hypothetical protein
MNRWLRGEFAALTEVALAAEGHRWHQTHFGGPWYTSAPTEYDEKAAAQEALDNALQAWRRIRPKE